MVQFAWFFGAFLIPLNLHTRWTTSNLIRCSISMIALSSSQRSVIKLIEHCQKIIYSRLACHSSDINRYLRLDWTKRYLRSGK